MKTYKLVKANSLDNFQSPDLLTIIDDKGTEVETFSSYNLTHDSIRVNEIKAQSKLDLLNRLSPYEGIE